MSTDNGYSSAQQGSKRRAASAADRLSESIVADADPDGMELVYMADRGGRRTLACMWPRRANKAQKEFAKLWAIIDGSTGSVTTIAPKLAAEMDAALSDVNLSPVGRHAAAAGALMSWTRSVESLGRRLVGAKAEIDAYAGDLAGVAPYSPSEPWAWAFDLEIARHARSMDAAGRRALRLDIELGAHMDMAEALLRVPPSLSGYAAPDLGRIRAALIEAKNPGMSALALLRHQCLVAAAAALDRLAAVIEAGFYVPTQELRAAFGPAVAEARDLAGLPIIELAQPLADALDNAPADAPNKNAQPAAPHAPS